MTRRRLAVAAGAALLALWVGGVRAERAPADTLPSQLSDQQFWQLINELSEPNGYFRSDNIVSNEIWLQWVIPDLLAKVKPGGVYMGVGPEQNFTYIAALKPRMVFITDVRRGNLHAHLMYKALFEMSSDRADFISRLFTKKRPEGLTARSSAVDIMNAYWDVQTSAEPVYKANLTAIQEHLTKRHGLPLSEEDLAGIESVYHAFYWFGPSITYNSTSGGGRGFSTTYYDLMVATDGAGIPRSFLASEDTFAVLKNLEQRNLIVPVVGNFAGPSAVRSVGEYVRSHGSFVMAYYLSNVEQYLYQDGLWQRFCANVATLPVDDTSAFIRSMSGGGGGGRGLVNSLGNIKAETRGCGGVSPPADSR